MNYYYKVFVVFEDKKLLKTIIKTNNIGRSIEALLNNRKEYRALSIKVVEIMSKYVNLPKDLLEDVELQTGADYSNEENLTKQYQEALIDLYELIITMKLNLNEILKNPSKYKVDAETKKLLEEIINFKNKERK